MYYFKLLNEGEGSPIKANGTLDIQKVCMRTDPSFILIWVPVSIKILS